MKQPFSVLFFIPLLFSLFAPQNIYGAEIINEVFLLEKHDKLLAFSGLRNNWFEKELHSGEKVVESRHDGNVAVAYTSERALAFSAITGRWTEERFRIRETIVSITAEGNVATVITNIRALGFSAKTGVWVGSQFSLGK